VLRACASALGRAGFRAAVAENGAAGLESFLHLREEICLVLSEVLIPLINGIEMAERILLVEPEAKILLMSGYCHEVIDLQGRNRFPFICKPFNHRMLIQKIRTVVCQPEGATLAP
jgi:two-component system, cell cycle sensor histidine kinase and response regulator CckA